MKTIGDFLKTTINGGLLVLLPMQGAGHRLSHPCHASDPKS